MSQNLSGGNRVATIKKSWALMKVLVEMGHAILQK